MKTLLLIALTIFSTSLWSEPSMVAQMNKEENFYLKHHQLKNLARKKKLLDKKIEKATDKKKKIYQKQRLTLLFWEKLFELNAKEIPLLLDRDRSSEKFIERQKISQKKIMMKTELYPKITDSKYKLDFALVHSFYQKKFKEKKRKK